MLAIITGSMSNVVRIFSFFKKFFQGIWNYFTIVSRVVYTLERHQEVLEKIQYEMSPNSGKSLRDVVYTIRAGVILNELRLKRLTSGWHVGIFEAEPTHGKCTWVNDTLCTMFGLTYNEMLDFGWLKAIARDERADVDKHWKEAVSRDIPYEWEYTVVNQQTTERFRCKVSTHALRNLDGTPLLYYGTVEKISS